MDARTLHEPLDDCAADGTVADGTRFVVSQLIELANAFGGLTATLLVCGLAWAFVSLIKWIVK